MLPKYFPEMLTSVPASPELGERLEICGFESAKADAEINTLISQNDVAEVNATNRLIGPPKLNLYNSVI
jgi:hypothetical protein